MGEIMDFTIINAVDDNIEYIKAARLYNIFEYAHDLPDSEVEMIHNHVNRHIPQEVKDYRMIIANDEIIGCFIVIPENDGVMLDEIFIEEEYRGKGIGTKIIKDIIDNNEIIYLWVYKENIKAVSLYERLGFKVKEETDIRYYMMRGL